MRKKCLMTIILFCFVLLGFVNQSHGLSQQEMENIEQQAREMNELGIPEPQARKMLTRMVQNQFRNQNRILAQQILATAARAGLPTEPIISKALEGMAKQAGEKQIIEAMEKVRERHAYAHRLARSLYGDKKGIASLAKAIADSLAAGMAAEDMEAVMARLNLRIQNRRQVKNWDEVDHLSLQTMKTVRTMARLGLPSSEVSATLCRALQEMVNYKEIQQLGQQAVNQNRGSLGTGRGTSSGKGSGGSDNGSGGGSGSGNSGGSGSGGGPGSGGSGGSNGGGGSGGGNGSGSGGGGKGK